MTDHRTEETDRGLIAALQLDQFWFIQLPDEFELRRAKIVDLTPLTVQFELSTGAVMLGISPRYARYKRDEVIFVEAAND